MPSLTPEQRSLRARIAVHSSWATTTDRAERTAPARRAALTRFENQVDPDRVLSPEERGRRAVSAQRAHMSAIALKSSRARARRAQSSGS